MRCRARGSGSRNSTGRAAAGESRGSKSMARPRRQEVGAGGVPGQRLSGARGRRPRNASW